MRLSDLKLGTKQGIAFAIILALLAGLNAFSIYRMTVIRDQIEPVATNWLPSALAIAAINSNTSYLRITQLQYLHAPDDSTRARLAVVMTDLIDRINLNRDAFEPLISTDDERRLYAVFDEQWEHYIDLGFGFLALAEEGRVAEADQLLNRDGQRVFSDMSATLEQLVLVNQASSFEASRQAEETFRTTRRVVQTLFGATVLISILIAWSLSRWITIPVRQLATAAEGIGRGDLGVRVELHGRDEIGLLADSFNRMTGSLREARERIEAQQQALRATNAELEARNRDLEDAMGRLRDAQQQLIMREKMASLGQLVAGVAHEINNPVGAVGSAADTSRRSLQIIKRLLEEGTDLAELRANPRFKTALEILGNNNEINVTASRRITEIVRSLKNFARLDESEYQEADIHEGLDSTLTLLHHELKNRVDVVKDYGELPRIQCYPSQLNQVFMNVLSNASQAIEGDGGITVRTRREGERVVVEIADTGKGIAPEDLERIFDPGFTTKGVGVGTGLGLSITYNIVKKHRGTIDARSAPGRGTTVTIRLPIAQEGVAT
jgi:signal transduction histidine kinase